VAHFILRRATPEPVDLCHSKEIIQPFNILLLLER
jgi:hypothetical protein